MVAQLYIARGDETSAPSTIPSPLPNVSSEAWSRFVRVMEVQGQSAVTPLGLGRFALRLRRLEDIGVMTNVKKTKAANKTLWDGDFTLPLTRDKFLENNLVQYNVFVRSVLDHVAKQADPLPEGTTLSGALAILHQAGPWALRAWTKKGRLDDESTMNLYNRANGIF